uniref:RxLR effector candidate protein n=1 Tax=Hyaloperonospora arabidopsidis (strain Emoy2) TaxID=559515 RepID=M4C3B4_HYAAE
MSTPRCDCSISLLNCLVLLTTPSLSRTDGFINSSNVTCSALSTFKVKAARRPTYCHALVGGCLERDFKHYHCQLLQPHGAFSTESVISSAVVAERSKYGATEVEEEESELEQELISQLKKLRVRDPMKISELLDPIEEDETAQPELTDNEILKEILGADDE